MKPDEFFEAFVLGNLSDCRFHPDCLRFAFNASVSASHLADHYYTFHKRHNPDRISAFSKMGLFVEHLSSETEGAFRDIRSIANAYKHLYTSADQLVNSTILSGGSLIAVAFPAQNIDLELIEDQYQDSIVGEYKSFVIFKRKDGTKAEFLPRLEKFIDYWSVNYA